MRILVPIRTSRETDESTGSESQRAGAYDYRDTHTRTALIFTDTEDLSISGATAIATRPGVAPWLTPGKIGEWDAIGVYEVDRLSRNMEDYLGFVRAMDKAGKIIIDLIDGTDTSTPEGRRTLEDRALSAQRYRESVAEKRSRKAQRMSDAGQWGGGRIPFGYMKEQRQIPAGGGKQKTAFYLVQDGEGAARTVRRMANDAINGKSLLAIAGELNTEGIASAIGRPWHDSAVRRVLTSPALMGYVVRMTGATPDSAHKNIVTIRRDRDGQPIKFTDDPILAPDQWRKLQDVIAANAKKRGAPQARRLLWNVAFCRDCSKSCEDDLPCATHDVKLYGFERVRGRQSKGSYYHCTQCGLHIRKTRFEAYVDYRVRKNAGSRPLLEYVIDDASEFSAEIIRQEKRIERWLLDLDTEYDANLEQAIANAQEKIKALIAGARKPREPRLVPVEPAITIGEHWAKLDPQGRNKFLRDTGAWFFADKEGVTGLLGWMGADSPDYKPLRTLTLPEVMTWQDIDEALARA